MEQMPERLERTTIYESEHVCLYTDKVRLTSGYTVGTWNGKFRPERLKREKRRPINSGSLVCTSIL